MMMVASTRDEWVAARKALLEKEVAMSGQLDALRAERRQLPWFKLEKTYRFKSSAGERSLSDLFGDRSQLAVYNFMLSPGSDHVCPGCALVCDHVDAARQHFEQADLAFAAVARVPVPQIEAVKSRMGWTFPWVSSLENEFNKDFQVSFSAEDVAGGQAYYNYGKSKVEKPTDLFGISIFAKDDDGAIYHTYSTYRRGADLLIGAFNWMDLTPKGRNEDGVMSWVRLHDQY